MKGHKDSIGQFHPHSNKQSAIHASDISEKKNKVKQIGKKGYCTNCYTPNSRGVVRTCKHCS